MHLDGKLKAGVKDILDKIVARTFDERDIKNLLIDCREYVSKESFTKDIMDFIAHPQRDTGKSYKHINYLYLKLLVGNGIIWDNKQSISIDVRLIQDFIFEGLLLFHIKQGKNPILSIKYESLLNKYRKDVSYYRLKDMVNINMMMDVCNKVCGLIEFRSGLESISTIVGQILAEIEKLGIYNTGLIDQKARNELGLCLLSLLHDREMIFTYKINSEKSIFPVVLQLSSFNDEISLNYKIKIGQGTLLGSFIQTDLLVHDFLGLNNINNPNGFHLIRDNEGKLIFEAYA